MLLISKAIEVEFTEVRLFYHTLIDMMINSVYKPGWKKGVYPSDEYLLSSIRNGNLYIGRNEGCIATVMIVNDECNDGYKQVKWKVQAEENEISIIHALGVLPTYSGRGYAKRMVEKAISIAKQHNHKSVRLDVLSGNLPAERLYTKIGFQYVGTVPMFYEDTGWTEFLLYEYSL